MITRELYAHVFCAVPWNRVISYDPGGKVLNEMKGCGNARGKRKQTLWLVSCVSLFEVKDHHREYIV